MRVAASGNADTTLSQPQDYYRVPIIDPSYVFGRAGWDLNLWDAVCYCRNRGRVAEFETDDLVAWFRGGRYRDERNAIRKAFQFALMRALQRGLVTPVFRTGKPVDDVEDPLAALRFFTHEGTFTLEIPGWDSEVLTKAPYLLKPCAYIENGWAGVIPPAGRAIFNVLLFALGQSRGRHLHNNTVYSFLDRYMRQTRTRGGLRDLIGLGLVSIDRDHVIAQSDRLLDRALTGRTKSSLSDLLAQVCEVIGEGADPVRAARLLDVLREADLLHSALDRPRFLERAYGDMSRFTDEGPLSALVLASRRWAPYPLAGRRWDKIVAHASGLFRRLKSGTGESIRIGRFDLWKESQFEIVPLVRLDLQRIDFDRAEILIEVAAEIGGRRRERLPKENPAGTKVRRRAEPVTFTFAVEDGEDNPITKGDWVLDASELAQQSGSPWSVRLDVTDELRRSRDRLRPDDVPLLQMYWRSAPPRGGLQATAVLALAGAHYLAPA